MFADGSFLLHSAGSELLTPAALAVLGRTVDSAFTFAEGLGMGTCRSRAAMDGTQCSILLLGGAGGGAIGFLGGVGVKAPKLEDLGGGVCTELCASSFCGGGEAKPFTAESLGGFAGSPFAFLLGGSIFTGWSAVVGVRADGSATTDGWLSPGEASPAEIDLGKSEWVIY